MNPPTIIARDYTGNFGDDLTQYLLDKLLGVSVVPCRTEYARKPALLDRRFHSWGSKFLVTGVRCGFHRGTASVISN